MASLPALNQLAETYADQIQFILLSQESSEAFQKKAYDISDKIMLLHANEDFKPTNVTYASSGNLEIVLPFPSAYFMDENKVIKDVKIGAPRVGNYEAMGGMNYTQEEVTEINLGRLENSIQLILGE